VGVGHLNRALTLADGLVENGHVVDFLIYGEEPVKQRAENRGYSCHVRSISKLADIDLEPIPRSLDQIRYDAVVLDLSHTDVLHSHAFKTGIFFDRLRKVTHQIAAFDSTGENSLLHECSRYSIDLLIIPYIVATTPPAGDFVLKMGPQYAVLQPEFTRKPVRSIRDQNANRVLVTCGGSDPTKLSPVICRALAVIEKPLEVQVAIGPLFCNELKQMIQREVVKSPQQTELLDSPESLAEAMFWCDLAVTTSGLTKYELAATGTPAISLSIDLHHNQANQGFAKFESVYDLGVGVSPETITSSVEFLLNGFPQRKKMSAAGRTIVDGQGLNRVVKVLRGLRDA